LGEAYCLSRGLDERCFDFSLSPWALLLLIGHMAWVLRRPSRLSAVY
jgi:hypothetical protein